MRNLSHLLCLVLLLFLSGCGVVVGTVLDTFVSVSTYPLKEYVFMGSYKYDNTWETPYHPIETDKDLGEMLVGVAISGGGSRSAYFAACVLETLSKIPLRPNSDKSFLDEIDYISSVSGGSLVSAYYCLKRPSCACCRERFFGELKDAMRTNFEIQALMRFLLLGYWAVNLFTYYDRGDLMASVWDHLLFDGATFDDLRKAEQRGSPTLMINATNLTDGLRFVFSTLQEDRFNRSDYFEALRGAGFNKYAIVQTHVPFRVIGFKSLNSDIRPYPISKAVVASAAVPNLLGPVTLKDYRQANRLVHLVDGGVYDNYGLESLMQIITAYLDRHPGIPTQIIVIDGSGYFEEQQQQSDRFTVAYYSERPLEISWLRTKHYMEYVCQQARCFKRNGTQPYRALDIKLVSLYDVLPSQKPQDKISQDPMLQQILRPDLATTDFLQKITTIQTRFQISTKDAQTIEDVAHRVTQKVFREK